MTHERLAVSSGLHTILTNYRVGGSPNVQNPQPTTSLLVFLPPKMSDGFGSSFCSDGYWMFTF